MNSENTDALAHLTLVRQQLILAQVRIMELEDLRDTLAPELAIARQLVQQAQILADDKIDALAHLKNQHASLETEYRHLVHIQHVTNEALNTSRKELAAVESSLVNTRQQIVQLEITQNDLAKDLQSVSENLAQSRVQVAQRDERLSQVDRELWLMKTSRSWRWTKVIRALERWLHSRPAS